MLGLLRRRAVEQSSNGTINKTARAVVSGSRPFNTVFGLPRNGQNITRSLCTFQSGSPPGHATINRRGKKIPVFQQSARLKSCQRFAPPEEVRRAGSCLNKQSICLRIYPFIALQLHLFPACRRYSCSAPTITRKATIPGSSRPTLRSAKIRARPILLWRSRKRAMV